MVSHAGESSTNFHALLLALDEAEAERVRAQGCRHCGGRLHVASFPRKVRGLTEEAVEAGGYASRLSFCCGVEECRRRATPPSVRFSLRRVYATVAVLALSLSGPKRALAVKVGEVVERHDAPAQATRLRWLCWWREGLLDSPWFAEMLTRFREPVSFASSPGSLLSRFSGVVSEKMLHLARWLSPLTTESVPPESVTSFEGARDRAEDGNSRK